ncbi:MAG: hypothetical protein RLZZ453_80 [Chlamydiota bacterium]|jgi:hypothetical protein
MSIAVTGFKGINDRLEPFFTNNQEAKCLVVIDIDEVLVKLKSPFYEADVRGVFDFTARTKELNPKLLEMVLSKIYSHGSVATDPDEIIRFFRLLQSKKIPHICLTTFRCPTYGHLKDSHLHRDKELKDLGMDLTNSYHFTADDVLEEFDQPNPLIRFFRSIVFTKTNKGQALLLFLEETAKKGQFNHIIAIDDQIKNLDSIRSIFYDYVTTFHYTAPALPTHEPLPDPKTISEELEKIIKECAQELEVPYGPPLSAITPEAAM